MTSMLHSTTGTAVTPHASTSLSSTALRKGIRVEREPDGAVRLDLLDRPIARLRGLPASTAALFDVLAAGDRLPEDLDDSDAVGLGMAFTKIPHLLAQAVFAGGRQLVLVECIAANRLYSPEPLTADSLLRLSKFALARRFHDELSVESPVTAARALLRSPAAVAVLDVLASTTAVGDAIATLRDLSSDPVDATDLQSMLALLAGAGIVGVADPQTGEYPTDSDEVLRQWEPIDLQFHASSRLGRTDAPFGGRFPYVGRIEPQPAVAPLPRGERIPLPTPDLEAIRARDPHLIDVVEARTSVRQYGSTPMTLEQLSELLFRVDRVRGTYGPRPTAGMPYQGSSRPYPCGGAGYELELYLTVRRCAGLEPAAYYYAPGEHALVRLDTTPQQQATLLSTASTSAGGSVEPDVLITITSRFQRLAWKYQAIAYAVTLKHVGVLYQSLYLTATAMGLAPCGLGSGNSQDAADAFGLDYLRESSVGEFLVGSLPETTPDLPAWNDFVPGVGADWQYRAQAEVGARTGRPRS